MTTVDDLRQRLAELNLTHSQRKLADIVRDDPEHIAVSTISALAADLNINESTVQRFSQALQLKGYSELRELCRQITRQRSTMLHRFIDNESSETDKSPSTDSLRNRLASQDRTAIASTFAHLEDDIWNQAVSMISSARHVAVAGLRSSFPAAALLSYLLRLVRTDVIELTDRNGINIDALRSLNEQDCMIAISTQPCSRDTVKAAEWAKQTGVNIISITDSSSSPLFSIAKPVIIADTDSASVLSSISSLVSVVQALANDVAAHDAQRTRRQLRQEEHMLNDFEIYAQ